MATEQVTILIPNYKTLELTKLCLRLIRKHTDLTLAKVIVIDNDSRDNSLAYLRTLRWIELIERASIPGESPGLSHSRALDLGLARVTTPYVLSIHTDTLVRNDEWLPFLLSQIANDPNTAGVGSWKLEAKPYWKKLLKSFERRGQHAFYKIIGKKNHALEGLDQNHLYLRSHCALYRTDFITTYQTGFSDGEEVAGKMMYRKLVSHGHTMRFLPSDILLHYMDHINHATTVLNPELSRNQKSVTKGRRRIQKSLDEFDATAILEDTSLDA
ncbi:MAG TPA: glycosyltransferase [Gammaproteobacteria bacterium]|nr:glycosyltransferase [Gammaproteobacteria bacterium]